MAYHRPLQAKIQLVCVFPEPVLFLTVLPLEHSGELVNLHSCVSKGEFPPNVKVDTHFCIVAFF